MNLGIIGCGAIGTDVALAADEIEEIEKIYIYDIKEKASANLHKKVKKAEIKKVKDFLPLVDVVFEGASQQAVHEYAEEVLKAGKDLILMSVGGLFEDRFRKKLQIKAREKKCKIYKYNYGTKCWMIMDIYKGCLNNSNKGGCLNCPWYKKVKYHP